MRTVCFGLLLMILASACNLPAVVPLGQAPSTTAPNIVTGVAPSTPPEHRIAIRVVNGVGEFYERTTGQKFVPRGMNYVRLAPQKREDGSMQVYHSVFDPGGYDPAE